MEDKEAKKENKPEVEELLLKTSRISFLTNYVLAFLAAIFLFLLISAFNLQFTFLPKTQGQLFSTLLILGIAGIIAWLIEQPEIERWMKQYKVTVNEVIEITGIFTKRKIILPYGSVSEVTMKRDPLGRILNYGDIYIGAFRTGSDINMKGIRNAHKIHEIIQNRINIIREGQMTFFRKKEEKK